MQVNRSGMSEQTDIIIIIIIKYICKAHFRDAANALKQQLHSEQKCLQFRYVTCQQHIP